MLQPSSCKLVMIPYVLFQNISTVYIDSIINKWYIELLK